MFGCCYRSHKLRELNHRNRSTTGSPIGNGLWPSMRWASFPHEWAILENQLGVFRSFHNFAEQITYIIIGGTYMFVMTCTQWQEFLIKLFRYVFWTRNWHRLPRGPSTRKGLGKERPKTWLLRWGAKLSWASPLEPGWDMGPRPDPVTGLGG